MATLFKASGGDIVSLAVPETFSAPNGLFPTTDRNDASAYSWASTTSTVTLPSSALADGYLLVAAFEYNDSSNGRFNPQGQIVQASGTGTFVGSPSGGYSRDNSEDRSYVRCWAFVDGPSASSTFQFQWKADTDDAGVTDGTARSEIQVIPFYYADIGLYSSTSASLYGGTTPNQVTGFTGTDGTNITISANVVSVTGDNKRYLALGSQFFEGRGGRTQRWHGLRIDGTKEDAAKAYSYYRNTANDESGDIFTWLLETSTATVTIDQFCYRGDGVAASQGGADIDGSTPGVGDHALVVIELNDSAEVFTSSSNADSSNLAIAGPVDLSPFPTANFTSDTASFARVSDSAVNVAVATDVLFGANVSTAQNTVSATQRWTAYAEVTVDGVEVSDSFAGDYMRNNQGTTDTFGWSANLLGFQAFALNEDIGFSVTELSGTEGGGGSIDSNSGWTGAWGVNLDTLEAAAGPSSIVGSTSIAFSQLGDLNASGELQGAESLAFSESSDLSGFFTKGTWAGNSLSPIVLPIAPYSFTAKAGGNSSIVGNESISWSESSTLGGIGQLEVTIAQSLITFLQISVPISARGALNSSTSIDFSQSGGVQANGSISSVESISFVESATAIGDGQLQASASVDFSQAGTLAVDNALQASESFVFSEAATVLGGGSLTAATSIDFSESGTLALDNALQGGASIGFSESVTASGTGQLEVTIAESLITFLQISVPISATGTLVSSESIDFSESGTAQAGAPLLASESIAFSHAVTASASGQLQATASIDVGHAATLIASGELLSTTSIDFSDVANLTAPLLKGDWGNTSISPIILPIRRYVFSPPNALQSDASIAFSQSATLIADGSLLNSTSVDFSQSATLIANGILQSASSVVFSESATLGTTGGNLAVSDSISFSESVQLTANGELQGNENITFSELASLISIGSNLAAVESIDFSESVSLGGTGSLVASDSVAFSVSATLSADGRLIGSESIQWSESGSLPGPLSKYDISPLVLPITRYTFTPKQVALKSSQSVDFSVTASITGLASDFIRGSTSIDLFDFGAWLQGTGGLGGDAIRGSTSIDLFGFGVWLGGKGQLQASASIDFSNQSVLNASLAANESITFATTATLTADGRLEASDAFAFSVNGGLSQDVRIQGSTSVDFSDSANLTVFGRVQANSTFALSNTGNVFGRGSLVGNEPVAFSDTGLLTQSGRIRGSATIQFINPGQLFRPIQGETTLSFLANASLLGLERDKVFATVSWQTDSQATVDWQNSYTANVHFQIDSSASVSFETSASLHCRYQDDAIAKARF